MRIEFEARASDRPNLERIIADLATYTHIPDEKEKKKVSFLWAWENLLDDNGFFSTAIQLFPAREDLKSYYQVITTLLGLGVDRATICDTILNSVPRNKHMCSDMNETCKEVVKENIELYDSLSMLVQLDAVLIRRTNYMLAVLKYLSLYFWWAGKDPIYRRPYKESTYYTIKYNHKIVNNPDLPILIDIIILKPKLDYDDTNEKYRSLRKKLKYHADIVGADNFYITYHILTPMLDAAIELFRSCSIDPYIRSAPYIEQPSQLRPPLDRMSEHELIEAILKDWITDSCMREEDRTLAHYNRILRILALAETYGFDLLNWLVNSYFPNDQEWSL